MMFKDKLVEGLARAAACLPRSYAIEAIFSRYVDRFAGDNDMDPETNGEYFILHQIIPTCDVIFDVGANEGGWTGRVLNINQTCRVHALEASSTTFELLKNNVRSSRVILRRLALGERVETLRFLTRQSHPHLSSFYSAQGVEIEQISVETEDVPVDTLDQYCKREKIDQIDFLKVDVEGHEIAVLRGAVELIAARKIRFLQFEYHATWIYSRTFLRDAFDLLHSAGYHIYKLLGECNVLNITRYSQDLDTFRYSNYIGARDEISLPGITVLDAKYMT